MRMVFDQTITTSSGKRFYMLLPFGCGGQLPHPLQGAKKMPNQTNKENFFVRKNNARWQLTLS